MALYVRSLKQAERAAVAKARRSGDAVTYRRARIIAWSAQGKTVSQIAEKLGLHPESVRRVIRQVNRADVAAVLQPRRQRRGPKPRVEAAQVLGVLELMHRAPTEYGLATQRWTLNDLAAVAASTGVIAPLSPSQLWRVLTGHGHGWKQAKRRMTSPDPEYEEKRGCARR